MEVNECFAQNHCTLYKRGGMMWNKGAQTKEHSSHFGRLGREKGAGCNGFQGQGWVVVMTVRRSQTTNVDTLQRWGKSSPTLSYLRALVCPENGEFS